MPFDCGQNDWQWAAVALCLWSLAPPLAPQDLVSNANVRCLRPEPEVRASLASGPDPVEPEPCLGAACDGWGRAGCRKPRAGRSRHCGTRGPRLVGRWWTAFRAAGSITSRNCGPARRPGPRSGCSSPSIPPALPCCSSAATRPELAAVIQGEHPDRRAVVPGLHHRRRGVARHA
jgi:hypothetical protein